MRFRIFDPFPSDEAKNRINARKKFGKDLSALLLLLIFFKVVV